MSNVNTTTPVAQYPSRADKFKAFDEATHAAYSEYLNLAWDVANQLHTELGGELGSHAATVRRLAQLPMLNKVEIKTRGYLAFSYRQIQSAISCLFGHFGAYGQSNPGLITRSWQRKKAARNVEENMATVAVDEAASPSEIHF